MTAKRPITAKRAALNAKRANGILVLRSAALAAAVALPSFYLACPVRSEAQNAASTPHLLDAPGLLGVGSGIFGGAKPAAKQNAKPGISFSETLRGNGSRAGYTLSHGNVQADTVSVHVGAKLLKPNADYWLDADSGTLIFSLPIRASDSVSVYYRYEDGPAAPRSPLGMPGLQLNLSSNTQLGLSYGLTSSSNGVDTSVYGLALNSKFGGHGIATYSGLTYFSNRQLNTNLVTAMQASSAAPAPKEKPQLGTDHLITQNFAVQSGGFRIHADYQDIGKQFDGFQALRLANTNNKAMLDQLTALEGEKGVRRMALGFGLGLDPKGKMPGGLQLDWNQIQDGKGAINQQSLGFSSKNLRFNYSSRDVGEKFSSFKGLREADRAQWEKEKGLKTTGLSFGLNFATGKKPGAQGALDFNEQNFGDKSGSLSRELVRFTTGGLGLTMLNRHSDKGFKRMGDLSDADKTAFAFDLYQQYDSNAKVEQVTANDKAQVAKEAGLTRDALRADAKIGKTGGVAFSQMRVTDAPQDDKKPVRTGLERESLSLDTMQFTLAYTTRKTDAGFTRIADLADVEKNYLALDIRRQFDFDAKMDQVTQKERDQAAKEVGLQRENLRGRYVIGKGGKNGTLTFNQFAISMEAADKTQPAPRSAIERQALNFAGKTFQLTYLKQEINDTFSRLADLSDIEKAQFGNEHGLSRNQLGLVYQMNKTTRLSFSSLSIGGTKDARDLAISVAAKANKDPLLAANDAVSGLRRQSFAVEATGLNFAANIGNTDKAFARSADLAMTPAEKGAIEVERGFERRDYALHFARIKGLLLDGTMVSADNSADKLRHDTHKFNLQFTPNKTTLLSYVSDADIVTADGKKNGGEHSLLTFNQVFKKGYLLNLYHDETSAYDKDKETQSTKIDYLHIETPKDKPNALAFDTRRVTFQNGKFENTSNLNVHAKPSAAFAFNYSHQDIDRGIEESADAKTGDQTTPVQKDPSESTDTLDFQWKATKQFSVLFGMSQKDTTDKKDGDTVSIGLSGMPFKDVTVAAKFDEVHNDGKNTKDVADVSISNSKPFAIGPIKDLTITCRYASLNDQKKLQNETMTGRASWKIFKNEFLLDYGGLTTAKGEVTISRVYSFTTDPNPKKWFHAGFLYKVRTLVTGEEKLIRRFTADWKLSKKANFVYTYGTMPEDEKGNITPVTTADIALKHALKPDLDMQFFYRHSDNKATKVLTRSLGCGLEGKIGRFTKLAVSYSKDANGLTKEYDRSDHLHFQFDHQMNADNFVSLSAELRSHDKINLQDEIQTNLDFRMKF